MNRINKGQKYVLRYCVSSGLNKIVALSEDINILIQKAEKYSKNNKSKRVWGFAVFERTGEGMCSEKLIDTWFA